MARFVLVTALSLLCVSCTYDPVTGSWYRAPVRWQGPSIEFVEEQPDSLEHHMAVQHYAREHNGKLPPPDVHVYP